MGCEIARSFVGLGLDDASDLATGGTGVDQVHAEEFARDEEGFAGVEGEGEDGG
jgi:hypothetical protein